LVTRSEQRRQALLLCYRLILLAVAGFCWLSLLTFDPADWPSPKVWPHPSPPNNICGYSGAWIAYKLFYWFGSGGYILVLFLSVGTIAAMCRGRLNDPWLRVLGVGFLVAGVAASVRMVSPGGANSLPHGNGGIVGIALVHFLRQHCSSAGTALIILSGIGVGLLLAAEGLAIRVPGAVGRLGHRAVLLADSAVHALTAPGAPSDEDESAIALMDQPNDERPPKTTTGISLKAQRRSVETKEDSMEYDIDEPQETAVVGVEQPGTQTLTQNPSDRVRRSEPRSAQTESSTELDEDDFDADRAQSIETHIRTITRTRQMPPAPSRVEVRPYPKDLGKYDLPPLSLLEDPEYTYVVQLESVVREKAKVLERTLAEFHLEVRVVEIETGPVITMYELTLAPGIKVSQIVSLSSDIARALKAPAVRVVAPIPGKNTIGIEVPNVDKENVRLKELITLAGNRPAKMQLPLFLGKDASGNPLISDLAQMPHMLIAGTTGSGKSVCLNSIVMSVLMTQRPDMVKLILVDPKMVEMSSFKDVPHLMCPIVTDMVKAEKILDWAATKMDERYELLAEAGVRNIAAYNEMTREQLYELFQPTSEEERSQIPYPLPHVIIIIDELADLMMTSAKEVEHHLSRLAQKSRAVGIHIVVATQRPEVKVVTGLIKSNLPCRIAFRVASRMDSRIVLDQNGAEVLMGQGDMLFLPPGSSKLVRAQGTYVSDSELRKVIEFLSSQTEPEFHPELVHIGNPNGASNGERDPLFDEAARIVIESGRGSVSLLQRRLTIGYGRASRLIDQMAEVGIVGTYKGSQAREVLVTLEEWEELKERLIGEPHVALAATGRSDDESSDDELLGER